jgi:hypothetical protein
MADLVITAASVLASTGAVRETGIAGAAIAAGEVVYKDSNNKYQLADADGAAALRTPTGIALNSAAANQPMHIQKSGDITLGAVLTAGTAYYLSDTPGKICPLADVTGGDYIVLLGLAESTTVLALNIQIPNVATAT